MAVAGSLTYDTKIDKNGFEKGISSLEKSTNQAMKNVLTAVSAVTTAIAGISIASINSYADLEQNVGGIETLFKQSADKVIKNAENAYKTAGLSANKYMETVTSFSASLLQSLEGDTEKAVSYADQAIIDMSDNSNKMGTSMEDIQNAYQGFAKQNYTMLDNLKLGYGGTQTEMERLIADANEVKQANGEMADLSIESFADITEAIHIVQNEMGITGTTAKEAEETISGSISAMKASWDNFLNGSGTFDQLVESAKIALNNIVTALSELLPRIAEEIVNVLPEKFITAVKIITPVLIALGTAIGVIWGYFKMVSIIKAVTTAFATLNAVMMANPIILIVSLIAGLIAGFIYLWNTSENFRNFWIQLWEGIKSVFEKVWNGIKTFFTETIPSWLNNFIAFCQGFWYGFTETLKNAWNGIVSFFTETIPQWIQNVINWFANLPYMIGYHIGQILGHIIQFGIDVWNWITIELPQIIQNIIEWFAQLPDKIWNWLLNTIENIKKWCVDTYNTTNQWISNTINSIIDWFRQLPGRIWEWLKNVINKVIEWGKNIAQKGKEGAINLFNNVVNTIKELPGKMLEMGKNIVEGIWNGIKNAKDWLVNKVKEFARGILDGIKNALGIHSPSTLFRDEVGKFIPQGIAVGIEADTDSALKAINNMNNDIMSEMNRAVAFETGSINAKASVKSNNSMLNVIQATFNIDGSVDIDGQRAGRIMAPSISRTLRTAGA